MSVKFYLVAMVFLLFDIEVAFLYPWALAHPRPALGRASSRSSCSSRCCSRGFVYIWRKGVLDWSRRDE